MRTMLFCVTQNNNSSLGNTLVRSVRFSQLAAWLAAQWCGLVVMCNVQHLVTNHTESQISQEQRAALPSPFTGGWLHMCSFKKMHYSLTSCQLYFLVPLSSFLAHLLALSLSLILTVTIMYAVNGQFPYTCICFVHGLNVLYVECLSVAMTNFQDHS